MLGIIALCILIVLVVIMLPVFKGIGSYKQKIYAANPELAEREERRRLMKLKKQQRQQQDDGGYRPSAWDEPEPAQSVTSGLRDRASQMMGRRGVNFQPTADVASSSPRPQNSRVGEHVRDASQPFSSHIDPNFDYDKFIAEEETADSQPPQYSKAEDVA